MRRCRALPHLLAIGIMGAAASIPVASIGKPLSPAAMEAIEGRLAPRIKNSGSIQIPEGGTVFLEVTKEIKSPPGLVQTAQFEGLVTGIISRPGIVVHDRLDDFAFEKSAGGKVRVRLRYAIHAEPGAKGGGRVRLSLNLVERLGLANSILKVNLRHDVEIVSPWAPAAAGSRPRRSKRARGTPSPALSPTAQPSQEEQLALDFWGYRHHAVEAKRLQVALQKQDIQLPIKDQAPLPPLNRASDEDAVLVLRFLQHRTRMWSAHRHLIVAQSAPIPNIRTLGRQYLEHLSTPEAGLPISPPLPGEAAATAAVSGERRTTGAGAGAGEAEGSDSGEGAVSGSSYAKFGGGEPRRSTGESGGPQETASSPSRGAGSPGSGDVVKPAATYDPTTEGDQDYDLPPSARPPPAEKTPTVPVTPVAPAQDAGAAGPGTSQVSTDLEASPKVSIPGYTRGLVLDDPNIAHALGMRFIWANVDFRASAMASALFVQGQVGLTPALGLELSLPAQFVSLDLERAQDVIALGNPLLAAKYRFFLNAVEGRRPSLTVRARWAIPFSPLHAIPLAPSFGAEEFSREAHFTDTYAFFLEKTAVGLGLQAAWQIDIVQFQAQFYGDYFFPVADAAERTSFLALHYGVSVGLLPIGPDLAILAEARATSLLAGPQRTEVFAYLGARGRFAEYFEPALFIALPFGSVSEVTGLQIGGELRVSYDLEELLEAPRKSREASLIP